MKAVKEPPTKVEGDVMLISKSTELDLKGANKQLPSSFNWKVRKALFLSDLFISWCRSVNSSSER